MVVSHNSGHYLQECLGSLLSQSLRRLEVIVVEDGSSDGSAEILRLMAAQDRRLRTIAGPRQGLSAARNLALGRARGSYLAFVNPADTVPRTAMATMVASLRRSGSDFAIGAVHRVRNGRTSRPTWVNTVHQADRIATSIGQFPQAMLDLPLHNRVFRKTFWDSCVGPLPEDNDHAELISTVTAYLRSTSFDVLQAVSYYWHRRSDHASIVQERYDSATLADRVHVVKVTAGLLDQFADAEVQAAWVGGLIDNELSTYCDSAHTGDDAYRQGLAEFAAYLLALAAPEALAQVRVDRRLRAWLASRAQWVLLDESKEFFRLNGATPRSTVANGRVTAVLPFRDQLGEDIPEALLELSADQTALAACVQKAFFNHEGLLEVHGWAFIRGIDLSETAPHIEARLVNCRDGRELPVDLEPQVLPAATRWLNQPNHDYARAGFRFRLDVTQLPEGDALGPAERWSLHVRNVTLGVERAGPVRSVLRSGVALRMRARRLGSVADPVRYVPTLDPDSGFTIQVRHDRVRAVHLTTGSDGQIAGRLRIVNPVAVPIVGVRAVTATEQIDAPTQRRDDGALEFHLTLPVGRLPTRWSFRAIGEDGRRYRVSWPDEPTFGSQVGGQRHPVTWLRSPRGFCDLVSDRVAMQAARVTVADETVTVLLDTAGLSRADVELLELRSPRARVPATRVLQTHPTRYLIEFPATTEIWGTPGLALPPGTYSIVLPGRNLRCGISDELLEQCPIFGLTSRHGFTVARTPNHDRLMLNLRAPLDDTERGRHLQNRLGAAYQERDFEPRDAVLFQCYRGEFSTDSQRALHEELWRRSSPLELLWAVSSYSVPLPEGAVPLLIGSRKWYEAVGSARYLCQNIDYDRFFRKRPYQSYLQTFHGYPWKSMGVSLWRAQGKSERLIAAECDRRNSAWDSILVPAPFCEELYRREYRYPHQVLVTGYPRDDALVTNEASRVRTEVLTRLGIEPDKKVVLYAPTWRDTVATGAWTAKFFDALDLDQLTEELGDDYVLLLRGHNYNLREGSVGSSASVLDVSSYPEVNDLILAADVAVLDYSSLRFDWLLTEKPVIFFVPDLADYLSARTVLFEYGPTAPGPLLNTTEEVVEALQNLERVRTDYAAARETFNLEFQGLHDGHATERVVDLFFGADSRPQRSASELGEPLLDRSAPSSGQS